MREHLKEIAALRRRIREAGEEVSDRERRLLWRGVEDKLGEAAVFGDLVLAAFFEHAKPKEREALRARIADAVVRGETHRYRSWLEELRDGEPPLAPFHWEIEFPEVFERENPGFDAMVGNPPFGGHVTVVEANVRGYTDWLRSIHAESAGKCDVVAHFFRRAFNLIRRDGSFGLIATNTIAQGDTRVSGLRWICENGGEIYRARRRVKWPGLAAVVVSVLHIAKGCFPGTKYLDNDPAEMITAFLFHRGGHDDPVRLSTNTGKSFQGSTVGGMGFTFDDTDTRGVTASLADMWRLIEENPRNQEAIFPYIGGEEVNRSPTHMHHRHVINFRDYPLRREKTVGDLWVDADHEQRRELRRQPIVPNDYPEPVAADWLELLAILKEKVEPERVQSSRKSKSSHGRRASIWWQYYHQAKELYTTISELERVLVIPQTSNVQALVFLPAQMVFGNTLVIFSLIGFAAFTVLQSRFHQVWSAFLGPTMKDDLRYTPSDCFETFPFPEGWETHPALEAAGKAYYDFRAALMVRNDEGLTKTYNRFHDPDERNPDITRLRDLHAAMDRAVLDAYGWSDLPTDCDFLLDYAIDEEEWGRRKKPWRYRWPDAIRDEVLARLLELNAARAAGEARAGAAARAKPAPGDPRPRLRRQAATAPHPLLMVLESKSLRDPSDG